MATHHGRSAEQANMLGTHAAANGGTLSDFVKTSYNGYAREIAEERLRLGEQMRADDDGRALATGGGGGGWEPPAVGWSPTPDAPRRWVLPPVVTFDWHVRLAVVVVAFVAGSIAAVAVAFAR